jgi:hypothetical protein
MKKRKYVHYICASASNKELKRKTEMGMMDLFVIYS